MGKRKSRAKPAPKKKIKLDTSFTCPFCNHESGVDCEMDFKSLVGVASCRICLANYHTKITALTEPIDIYSEWVDECHRVNAPEDEDAKRNVGLKQTHHVEDDNDDDYDYDDI